MRRKLFSWHCFDHFPKTTAPQHVIFSGKLSTIIIFKLCKFSVNLWTLCFLSYIDPLNSAFSIIIQCSKSVLDSALWTKHEFWAVFWTYWQIVDCEGILVVYSTLGAAVLNALITVWVASWEILGGSAWCLERSE